MNEPTQSSCQFPRGLFIEPEIMVTCAGHLCSRTMPMATTAGHSNQVCERTANSVALLTGCQQKNTAVCECHAAARQMP
eukprot:1157086-Pelagomonas_calceolata.AAC.5